MPMGRPHGGLIIIAIWLALAVLCLVVPYYSILHVICSLSLLAVVVLVVVVVVVVKIIPLSLLIIL